MDISALFIIIMVILWVGAFFPDIFPYCISCKKIKPRVFFTIHRNVRIRLWYSANESVCSKCCRKYRIDDFDGLKRLKAVKKKVKMEMDSKF